MKSVLNTMIFAMRNLICGEKVNGKSTKAAGKKNEDCVEIRR